MKRFSRFQRFRFSFHVRSKRSKCWKRSPKLGSLQLDAVRQGRQRQSRPMLLQLPAELQDLIIDLLEDEKKNPASLALVNRRCRELALQRQFKEIRFSYSPRSRKLFRHMDDRDGRIFYCILAFGCAKLPLHLTGGGPRRAVSLGSGIKFSSSA